MGNIRKDGPNTVIFELESGNADFPYLLSDYHILIGPADSSGNIDWEAGDGTGAYSIKSFEPGVGTHLIRNPNYWKEGRGHFDECRLIAINDAAARMNAMATGQVDAIARTDLKTVGMLKKKPGVEILQVAGTKHFTYPMDVRQGKFSDNNVRMALKLGINRQTFVDTVLRGYGSLGNDHPISVSQNYCATEIPQRQYDPDKARWHLLQSGYGGLDVEIHASDAAFSGAVDATALYAEAAKGCRYQYQGHAGICGWILVEHLDEGSLVGELLEWSTDGRLDVYHRLCEGRRVTGPKRWWDQCTIPRNS